MDTLGRCYPQVNYTPHFDKYQSCENSREFFLITQESNVSLSHPPFFSLLSFSHIFWKIYIGEPWNRERLGVFFINWVISFLYHKGNLIDFCVKQIIWWEKKKKKKSLQLQDIASPAGTIWISWCNFIASSHDQNIQDPPEIITQLKKPI